MGGRVLFTQATCCDLCECGSLCSTSLRPEAWTPGFMDLGVSLSGSLGVGRNPLFQCLRGPPPSQSFSREQSQADVEPFPSPQKWGTLAKKVQGEMFGRLLYWVCVCGGGCLGKGHPLSGCVYVCV